MQENNGGIIFVICHSVLVKPMLYEVTNNKICHLTWFTNSASRLYRATVSTKVGRFYRSYVVPLTMDVTSMRDGSLSMDVMERDKHADHY